MTGTIEIIGTKPTRNGQLRLTFLLKMDNSKLTLSGFRYDPEQSRLLPPSFMGRRGARLPIVEAHGELARVMLAAAHDAYSEMTRQTKSY